MYTCLQNNEYHNVIMYLHLLDFEGPYHKLTFFLLILFFVCCCPVVEHPALSLLTCFQFLACQIALSSNRPALTYSHFLQMETNTSSKVSHACMMQIYTMKKAPFLRIPTSPECFLSLHYYSQIVAFSLSMLALDL